jgi:hypothetical protein
MCENDLFLVGVLGMCYDVSDSDHTGQYDNFAAIIKHGTHTSTILDPAALSICQ